MTNSQEMLIEFQQAQLNGQVKKRWMQVFSVFRLQRTNCNHPGFCLVHLTTYLLNLDIRKCIKKKMTQILSLCISYSTCPSHCLVASNACSWCWGAGTHRSTSGFITMADVVDTSLGLGRCTACFFMIDLFEVPSAKLATRLLATLLFAPRITCDSACPTWYQRRGLRALCISDGRISSPLQHSWNSTYLCRRVILVSQIYVVMEGNSSGPCTDTVGKAQRNSAPIYTLLANS